MSKTYVYISRWPEFVGEPGIALLEFNPENGDMKFLENLEEYLQFNQTVLDRKRNILYINNEVAQNPDYFKGGGGLIYAYKIDPETGHLKQISRVPACCPCPSYISMDPTGKYLICANHSGYFAVTKAVQKEDGTWGMEILYDDATVDLFELNEDGTIGNLIDVHKHTGLNPLFLLHAHPHSAVWDPQGRFFACNDKGEDLVYMYRINYETKKLELMCEPYQDENGSCPRYCAFHPDPAKPFFFQNHEGNTTMTAYRYNENAQLEKIGSVSCIPDDMKMPKATGFKPGEKPAQQAMAITPDGKYIYDVLNGKGLDGVSVFEVNQDDGSLKLIQYLPVDGVWARGVGIAPDGKHLIIVCMDDDGGVMSFKIGDDGKLTPTGARLSIPGAAYVTFYTVD